MLAYSNAGNQYRQQSAMTAAPGELTLMLYDGAIKNLKLAKLAITNKDLLRTNEVLQKTQAIISELMSSLDMRYDISAQLMQLYDYMLRETVQANVHKDEERVDQVLELMIDLRDTWQQAVRLQRQQQTAGQKIVEA